MSDWSSQPCPCPQMKPRVKLQLHASVLDRKCALLCDFLLNALCILKIQIQQGPVK